MLIDREGLLARLNELYRLSAINGLGLEPVIAMKDIKALIFQVPGVEAVLVKHGRWEPVQNLEGMFKCSLCGDEWGSAAKMVPMQYCPSCGAKMDLEEQDAQTDHPGK